MNNKSKAANENGSAKAINMQDYFELAGHYEDLVLAVQTFVTRHVEPSADAVLFLRRFEENVAAASNAINRHAKG